MIWKGNVFASPRGRDCKRCFKTRLLFVTSADSLLFSSSPSSLPILKFSPSFLEHTTSARCQKTLDLCAPSLAAREEERRTRERERKASSSVGGDRHMVRENPLLLKLVRCRESHTHTHTHKAVLMLMQLNTQGRRERAPVRALLSLMLMS